MSFFFNVPKHEKRPNDAIEIPPQHLIEFFNRVVQGWRPSSDIWALAHGPSILGTSAALSGIYILSIFRKKLRLGAYGQMTSFMPIVGLPIIMSALLHRKIQGDIFLDPNGCIICKEMESSAIQVGTGVIQPIILSMISSYMYATRHFTYRIPSAINEPKACLKFTGIITKKFLPKFYLCAALQLMIATYVTHMEVKHFFWMQNEMVRNVPESEFIKGNEEEMKM